MERPGLTHNEAKAYDALTAAGWIVARSGWPDFLVYDPIRDKRFGIEWKVGPDIVRPSQERMHLMLQRHFGVDVLVTGNVNEALEYEPREPSWLMVHRQRVGVDHLEIEAARLERACDLLRGQLVELEAEWKKLKGFRDEQKVRIARGNNRLKALEAKMREVGRELSALETTSPQTIG